MTLLRVVRKIAMPVQFDDRTIEYIVRDATMGDKPLTGRTNPQTWQLWKEGYVVLKNFIPKDIVNFTLDAWKVIELDPENYGEQFRRELDIIHNSPKDSLEKSLSMYSSPFGVALHHWCWQKLKHVIDMDLQETYSFSRKYERGAYLKAHADRPSCEISATLCLDYKTDDNKPWSIWVDNTFDYVNNPTEIFDDTQAVPIRKRKTARKIDLEVGDLLLYQGPNVAHWREYLLGEYSYHIFLHFLNVNGKVTELPYVHDIVNDHLPEKKMVDHNYNPWRFDGRVSRHHPIEERTPERQAYLEFTEKVWENDEVWMHLNKSDFVNDFSNFIQIKDGKEIEDKKRFQYKHKETEAFRKRVRHQT